MAISKYKNKKGVFYEAQVWVRNCKIASKRGFARKRDAVKWHDDTKNDYEAGNVKQDHSIEELIAKYKEVHYPMISENSRLRYDLDIDKRILPFFRYRKVKDLRKSHIDEFRAWLAKDYSPKGVNCCLAMIKTILKMAEELGWIETNPAIAVKKMKLSRDGYSWFDDQSQISAYLEAAKSERYYLMFKLALETGMRRGEIIGLGRKDICFKTCSISVWKQYNRKLGKFTPPKSNQQRHVTFARGSDLERELKHALKTFDHKMPIVYKKKSIQLLFHTPDQHPVNSEYIGHDVHRRICRNAGVPVIRFHDLRHTFASWYMMTQDNIWELRKILGHSDIAMTMRYSHLSKRSQPVPSDLYGIINSDVTNANPTHKSGLFVVPSGNH